MGVLTHKEFEQKKNKPVRKAEKIDIPAPVEKQEPVIENNETYFYLFYPDNSSNNYYTGRYIVEWKGEMVELWIYNGVIRTDKRGICEKLVMQGFSFMYEKGK